MLLKGLESARIGIMNPIPYGSTNQAEKFTAENIFTIDSSHSGGTISANITGLGAQAQTIYASNVPKQIRANGSGSPALTLGIQDLDFDVLQKITGVVKDATGVYSLGRGMEAPYCAVELVSTDAGNNHIYLALLKGTFQFVSFNPQTDQANNTMQTDSIQFTGCARNLDNQVFKFGYEGDPTFSKAAWDSQIFPFDYAAVDTLTVAPTTANLAVGGTQQLTATIAPSGANQAVSFVSSNPTIATVTGSGLVTGIATGTATVTVTSLEDSSKTASVSVTVA